MSRQIICPHCRSTAVRRSRPQSPRERLLSWVGIVALHCQHCSHRFSAWSIGKEPVECSGDRREHLRVPVRLCLSFSGGKVQGEGTVMDLSLGGCVIKSDTKVCVNDIFYLAIAIVNDDAPIEVAAMVHSVSARGIAFKFLRKAKEDTRLLSFIQSWSEPTSSVLPQAVEPMLVASLSHDKGSQST